MTAIYTPIREIPQVHDLGPDPEPAGTRFHALLAVERDARRSRLPFTVRSRDAAASARRTIVLTGRDAA
jgi:hypothetical protein